MSVLHQRHAKAAIAALASALVLATLGGGAAAAGPAVPRHPSTAGSLRAVVALTGTAPVTVRGVRVVSSLPAVRAEVVTGSPAALAALAADPRVRGMRPDARVPLSGHDNDAGRSVAAWEGLGGQAGRAEAGRGVTVALVDTGVTDSPALNRASGRLVDAVDTSPLVDLQQPLSSGVFADGYGHGTFMASLIAGGPVAATGNRAVGVAPGATVDVVKVAKADGTTSLSAVLAGLNWVALHADSVQVANVALGLPTGGQWGADPLNLATEWVRDAGVLVVAAAGNTAGEVADPGIDPRALTVGAADTTAGRTRVAPFSGSGLVAGVAKPDVVASGVGLLGVLPPDSVIARENPDALRPNGLWRGSGTSEATAVTSGTAALYLADHPDASPADAKGALRGSARPLRDAGAGAGVLRAAERAVPRESLADTGELGFDELAWTTSPWAAASWAAASWAAASWARAASWAAASWQGEMWSSAWWQAASWARSAPWSRAASWAAASWAAASWAAASWADQSWGDGPATAGSAG